MNHSIHHSHRTRRYAAHTVYAPDRIGIVAFNDVGFVIAKPADAHVVKRDDTDTVRRVNGVCDLVVSRGPTRGPGRRGM